MTEETNEIEVNTTELTIGQILIQAREDKKISISEAASELTLTTDTLINLEKEQWENLHGRTYARGYFLSYVRFLGLPEDEALMAFNANYRPPVKREPSVHQPKTNRFPVIPVVFLALVIAVTGFAYQHWQNSKQENQLNSQQDSSTTEQIDSSQQQIELEKNSNNEVPLMSKQEN